MSRAKLYMIPGTVWHLTHRCHDRAFLLRFARDRRTWLHWMYRATTKYGLRVLNYAVTSNHIHLIVYIDRCLEAVSRSMLLAASRTALVYNRRKHRSGAFWEDNYHATAIDTDSHLRNCLVYVDLNMARARVVDHPADWPWCGWQEISGPRERRCLIDKTLLAEILGFKSEEILRTTYERWIEEAVGSRNLARQPKWTESIAVGREAFVDRIRGELGLKVVHRKKAEESGSFVLRERRAGYNAFSLAKSAFKTSNWPRFDG